MNHAIFIALLLTILVVPCRVGAEVVDQPQSTKESEKKTPKCIARFCFGADLRHLPSEAELLSRYGRGYVVNGKFSAYCYKVLDQNLFVRFRPYHGQGRYLTDVFVSDVPSCSSAARPEHPFASLSTAEGLEIGDPYEKVIAIYGTPDSMAPATGIELVGYDYQEAIKRKPFGEKFLIYWPNKDQSLHANIYIRGNRVSAILISVSP